MKISRLNRSVCKSLMAYTCSMFIMGCSSSSNSGESSGPLTDPNPVLSEALSKHEFSDIPGEYVNIDFGMRYSFERASLTIQTLNEGDTFQVKGNRILFNQDTCISVIELDFFNASFMTDEFGTEPRPVSPPAINIARVNQISLASYESFSFYGYDETAGESAEFNTYVKAREWDDYHSGGTYFGVPDDGLGYNVPLGMCVRVSEPAQYVDIILVALNAMDGASVRLRPQPEWESLYLNRMNDQ